MNVPQMYYPRFFSISFFLSPQKLLFGHCTYEHYDLLFYRTTVSFYLIIVQFSLSLSKQMNSPRIGISNVGNSCFFGAVTQFLLTLKPLRSLLLSKNHSTYCDKNCFICHWEKFAISVYSRHHICPKPSLRKLAYETRNDINPYIFSHQYSTSALARKILEAYDIPELKATIENVTYCVDCMKNGISDSELSSTRKEIVHVIPYRLKQNTSNVFADESEVIDIYACEKCNFRAGFFDYERANDMNDIARKFSTKITQTSILKVGDYALFDIGRGVGDDMRNTFTVTSQTNVFRGVVYQPLSWIEHRTLSGGGRHYVAFGLENGGYTLFDDYNTKVNASNGVVHNKLISMLIDKCW